MDKRRWSVIYRDTRAWRRLRNFLVEAERTDFSNRTPPLAERGVAPSWPWQVQGRSQPTAAVGHLLGLRPLTLAGPGPYACPEGLDRPPLGARFWGDGVSGSGALPRTEPRYVC